MTCKILVCYFSRYGTTQQLARAVSRGASRVPEVDVLLRTVAPVSDQLGDVALPIPNSGPPYCSLDELASADGIAIGSPTYFGNMAASMKYFWDQTGSLWQQGALVNKPAVVFTSTGSLHGGMESTLLSMILPMMHHGMMWLGLPYTEPDLNSTRSGGSPYGACHFNASGQQSVLQAEESRLAEALGQRLAWIAKKLM